jgi:CRISPR/Cas system CSM-associated protein Csm2 small subunit
MIEYKDHKFTDGYKDVFLGLHRKADHKTIDAIHTFVKQESNQLSGSQLRKIYNLIKKSKAADAPFLRVKMAYIKGRTDKAGIDYLVVILDDLLREVNVDKQTQEEKKHEYDKFESIKAFVEAIISFYAVYGTANS